MSHEDNNPNVGDEVKILKSEALRNQKGKYFNEGDEGIVTKVTPHPDSATIYTVRWKFAPQLVNPVTIDLTRSQFDFSPPESDDHQLV